MIRVHVGREENINNAVLTKEHLKIMEQSKIKLSLKYGSPAISNLELEDGKLVLELLVPGVTEKSMVVVSDPQKIMVEHEVDDRFVGKFKFFLYSNGDQEFKDVRAHKDNGLLVLTADVATTTDSNPQTITV